MCNLPSQPIPYECKQRPSAPFRFGNPEFGNLEFGHQEFNSTVNMKVSCAWNKFSTPNLLLSLLL